MRQAMRSATVILAAVLVLLTSRGAVALQAPPAEADPRLARTMPEVETAILHALIAANLTERLTWIAADTNGHLTIGWLVVTYPADLTDPVAMLQARAWDLVRTTLTAVPSLDEIHVTGLSRGSVPFGANRHLVTFSAAMSRAEFRVAERSANAVPPSSLAGATTMTPCCGSPGALG